MTSVGQRGVSRSAILLGAGVFAAVGIAALLWAKWLPYTEKTFGLLASGSWSGGSILDTMSAPGSAPSLKAGWDFTLTYSAAVWKALLTALVIAALADALIPRTWLLRALSGRGALAGSVRGGLASVPFMMCTCCTAPLAVKLRRSRVPISTTLAYWVGNPLLNPAVLVFLVIVAPWQWSVLRLAGGVALTIGATALIGRWLDTPGPGNFPELTGETRDRNAPRRFLASLGRMSVTLVPEYLLVVFAVGALGGWLFPFDGSTVHSGVLAMALAAVVGTLVVIPTAGEIPVLFALAAAGAGPGVLGVLLIVLPAVSLPSMIMVGRALSWRATLATAGSVAAVGLLSGGLLTLMAS